MDDESLNFPDQRRSELESTIGELLDRAHLVLAAQDRLRNLLLANQLVVEDLDLGRVLHHIVEAAVTLVDAQYGALGVIDREGLLEEFIHVGMPEQHADAIGHLPEGHGVLGAVIQSESPIRLDDLGADPRSVGFPAHHPPMGTFLGVPIRVRGEIYGNLYLTNRAGGAFTDEDEELVLALASTAALAIDNARRYEESRRLERLSTALSEIRSALLAADSEDILGAVAERAGALLEANLVFIVVSKPNSDGALYRVETARGVGADRIEGTDIPHGDSLVARAMAGGGGFSVSDLIEPSSLEAQLADRPVIAVPLVVAGAPSGALCASRDPSQGAFTDADLSTLSEFAAQVGLALALAQARVDRQQLDVVEERARIARDLHDNVIQRLFGTGLGLQALASRIPAHSDAITAHVDEIDGAIADFRTAIFSLQNSGPESVRHRLLDVVTELAPNFDTPPRIAFSGPLDLVVKDDLADDAVAVLRESLSNVARHARAKTTEINVSVTTSHFTITVDDDGIGIPVEPTRKSGTVNLVSRAHAHGGICKIEPRVAGGTRVRWHVPLESLEGPL